MRRPEDNQDTLSVLYEKHIISQRLYNKIIGLANFRNILVHDYEKIDRGIVYAKLKKNLDDFIQFRNEVLKFIDKNEN